MSAGVIMRIEFDADGVEHDIPRRIEALIRGGVHIRLHFREDVIRHQRIRVLLADERVEKAIGRLENRTRRQFERIEVEPGDAIHDSSLKAVHVHGQGLGIVLDPRRRGYEPRSTFAHCLLLRAGLSARAPLFMRCGFGAPHAKRPAKGA